MKALNVPGVVWVSLLVALSAFLTANWPDALWLNLVTVALGAIIKALEVQQPADTNRLLTEPGKSKTARWLWG